MVEEEFNGESGRIIQGKDQMRRYNESIFKTISGESDDSTK
jgi:hypothetical protein